MVAKNDKQFKDIKMVCCKYFEKYDKQLEGVLDQSQEVMKKYENWSKVLIEPSSMNDARLFALETRLHTEEDTRVREYDYLKDILRKVVFTLEEDVGEDDDKSEKKQKTSEKDDTHENTPVNDDQAARYTFGAWDDNPKQLPGQVLP